MPNSLNIWIGFLAALVVPLILAAFSPLPLAFFMPLLGLISIAVVRLSTGAWLKPDWPLYGWIGALCVLGALSSLWSIAPQGSIERAWKIGALLLFSLPLIDAVKLCPQEAFIRIRLWIPAALVLVGTAICTELFFNFPIYRWLEKIPEEQIINGSYLNKNVAIFTLVLPIALLICRQAHRHFLALTLIIVSIAVIALTESQAAQLALGFMMLGWCSLFIMPVAGLPAAFTVIALILIFMPWIAPIAFDAFADQMAHDHVMAAKASTSARLENWDFISRKILSNPWTGFGMDATRSITDFHTDKLYFANDRIMHPHNLALQIWIEFGLPGIIITLGFLGYLYRRLVALPPQQRRLPFALLCGALIFLMVSWSLWSGWLLASLLYVAALMVLAAKPTSVPVTSSPPR